jgi:hypothetical protein
MRKLILVLIPAMTVAAAAQIGASEHDARVA